MSQNPFDRLGLNERSASQQTPSPSAQNQNPFDRLTTGGRVATPTPFATTASESPDEGGGILDTVLDVVSTPGRMTAGAVRAGLKGESVLSAIAANRPTALGGTREDDFDDVLADVGMEDSLLRRGLGLAGDVVVDPLNLTPAGWIKSGAKLLGKATGVSRAIDAVKATDTAQAIAKRLVPYHGLDKFKTTVDETLPSGEQTAQELSYQDLRRLHQSKREFAREGAGRLVLNTYPGLKNDDAYEIALALDEGRVLTDLRLENMREATERLLDDQFTREVQAGTIDAASKRDDYVTHLLTKDDQSRALTFRALTGKNPFQVRKELTLRQGADAGVFEKDIRKIVSERVAKGNRAVEDAKFITATMKQFGKKLKVEDAAAQAYRRPFISGESPLKDRAKGIYLPEPIAADLEKLIELPAQGDAISNLATAATALWKGYATRANIGYHVRNAVGNMMQTWFAGVGDTGTKVFDPFVLAAKHAQAARHIHKPSSIGPVGRYSGDQVRQALNEYGVLGGHHTSFNELDNVIDSQLKKAGKGVFARNLNPLDRDNWLLHNGALAGNAIENTSRLAVFLDQVGKGQTLEQAALHVRKYLYDYNEITDDVRKVRDRFVPFATWYVKNIPQQIDNVLSQPDKVASIARAFEAIEDTTEDRGLAVDPKGIPEWMRGHLQMPVESDQGAAVFIRPNLPIEDLNKLEPSLENAERNGLSSLNPLMRMPLELATNRQFFMGTNVYDENLGPMDDYRKANPMVGALSNVTPAVAETLFGAVKTERGTEMPAVADYLMRQLPPVTQYGKPLQALTRDEGQDTGEVLGFDLDMLPYAGLSVRPLSDVEIRNQKKVKASEEAKRKKAGTREKRRLTKADVKLLYDRYSKEP